MHHFEPENKKQSMAYHHKISPAPKKFIPAPYAGKVMQQVFLQHDNARHHTSA
jgi:hypothetical protein